MKQSFNLFSKYQYLFFDLDGTVTDPMQGITRSVAYALNHFGIVVNDLRELCPFIGPPLKDSFIEFYQFTEVQAEEAVKKYRERYSETGLYENEVYPGMAELLEQARRKGYQLMMATSKPDVFANSLYREIRRRQSHSHSKRFSFQNFSVSKQFCYISGTVSGFYHQFIGQAVRADINSRQIPVSFFVRSTLYRFKIIIF